MIVFGDLSGIQSYVFDVPEAGGGQARRLRARSFLVQGLAECAARRVLNRLGWPADDRHFPFAAAGKFLLRGEGDATQVAELGREMNAALLARTGGTLRIALAAGDGPTEVEAERVARRELQRVKSGPYRPAAAWDPAALVLDPLGTPCELCRRERGAVTDRDPDTHEDRFVCRTCDHTYNLGRRMPTARAVQYRLGTGGDFDWLGVSGTLAADPGPTDRRLRAGIPLDANGTPMWFTELATEARGDRLLAVLKADVDSLGAAVERVTGTAGTLDGFFAFAKELDAFFADTLQDVIERGRRPIYTVFAGGDDLVMIGPWDKMVRFAGEVRELFRKEFPDLTLSAGLALFKPKRPVKTAVEQAERLLDDAKTGPKDQCAAFGQVWSWGRHADIIRAGERLAGWATATPNRVQRGWLHTVLELVEARHRGDKPDLMATARLAYHVSRNWKDQEARGWAEDVVRRFDDPTDETIRYLPAVLRYALTATRGPGDRE